MTHFLLHVNLCFIFIKIFYTFTKDFKQGMPFCNQTFHRLSWLLFGKFKYWLWIQCVYGVKRGNVLYLIRNDEGTP